MKKLFNVLFCMLLVFSLFGCSDENKQIEEKILKQNYCVDVCETAISLKTFYEGISSRSIRYDDDSESLIAFQDENLLEDVWVDPVNKKVLGNYGDIVISDWMVDKLCEVFNKDLKSIGITTDQLVEYMQYKMENDPNGKVSNDESRIKKEDYPEPIVSETQKYYSIAKNIDRNDSRFDMLACEYNGFELLSGDCSERYLRQSAFYRKTAKLLDGYRIRLHDGSKISEFALDVRTNSREEFEPYYENLRTFIVLDSDDPLTKVMNKFEELSTVKGTFNYTEEIFEFNISNIQDCAKEMGISEQMLGYILAMLDEYGPIIEFKDSKTMYFKVDVNRTNKSL